MTADCEAIQNKYRQTLSLDRIHDISLWVNKLEIALKHMSGILSLDTIPDGGSTADISWLSKFRGPNGVADADRSPELDWPLLRIRFPTYDYNGIVFRVEKCVKDLFFR